MKIVVCPHDLGMGGSQMNAVELGAALRDRGHEVSVFGRVGTLCDHIDALGLPFVEAPEYHRTPSPVVTRALRDLLAADVDVVHAYEWTPGFEAFAGAVLARRGTAVCSIMSMSVASFLPRTVPLIVGTEEIGASIRDRRPGGVWVVEPPVDTETNSPAIEGADFRAEIGIEPESPLLVVVSRLANELKLEGLQNTMHATELLDARFGASLVVVGDGPARAQLDELASGINGRLGRRAVALTGELRDPRPAYAAADVTLGMGSSALRAMAFARPLVVLGENGFAEVFAPDSAELFLWQGFYGLGDPSTTDRAAARLADLVGGLLVDAGLRDRLGTFGRATVVERFSLTRQAALLEGIYRDAQTWRPSASSLAADLARSCAAVLAYKVRHKLAARRGHAAVDDMNAKSELAARMRVRT